MATTFEEAARRAAEQLTVREQRKAAAFAMWHATIAPVLQEVSRLVGEDVMHIDRAEAEG